MLPHHAMGLALGTLWAARRAESGALACVLYYASAQYAMAFFGAMLGVCPRILGKTPDGDIPEWAYAAFWPIHAVKTFVKSKFVEALYARGPNPPATEVLDGWWVGGRYADECSVPWVAIVDCCNEFPRAVRGAPHAKYRLAASWDATACQPSELQATVEFLAASARDGPVLVHCASGKGRSACVMVAALIHLGHCKTLEEAQAVLLSKRRVSHVLKNPLMRFQLQRWFQTHHAAPGRS